MNRLTTLALTLLCTLAALAAGPLKRNAAFEQYIERYKAIAQEEMRRYGIPASITLAQGLLESGAGTSELATRGNNHFGIKCHGWTGQTIHHDDDLNGECFRAYGDARESFEDHSRFLHRDRYRRLYDLSPTDYRGWAHGLKACGYATNPRYAQRLIDIIETYELYRLDTLRAQPAAISSAATATPPPARPDGGTHVVHPYNGSRYLYARTGDTFATLARETGTSARQLAQWNDLPANATLHEGDIIYLDRKAKRAERRFKDQPHTVKAGQSLHLISQLYGIRLESLMRMNPQLKAKGWQVNVGDKLRVR